MSGRPKNFKRSRVILEYLKRNSDPEHPVTRAELLKNPVMRRYVKGKETFILFLTRRPTPLLRVSCFSGPWIPGRPTGWWRTCPRSGARISPCTTSTCPLTGLCPLRYVSRTPMKAKWRVPGRTIRFSTTGSATRSAMNERRRNCLTATLCGSDAALSP